MDMRRNERGMDTPGWVGAPARGKGQGSAEPYAQPARNAATLQTSCRAPACEPADPPRTLRAHSSRMLVRLSLASVSPMKLLPCFRSVAATVLSLAAISTGLAQPSTRSSGASHDTGVVASQHGVVVSVSGIASDVGASI